ncbi:hypothetical protein D3C85_1065550 [compost metagenome]
MRAGDFLAQQGFVADDHRLDHIRVGIGRGNQGVDFLGRVDGVGIDPGATHDLQAVLARQCRNAFEPGHRVGADALEARGQQGQVRIHAFGAQLQRLVEGRLVFIERGVGGALQLVRGAGHVRQHHRLAQAIPECTKAEQADHASKQIGQGWEAGIRRHGRAVREQSRQYYL